MSLIFEQKHNLQKSNIVAIIKNGVLVILYTMKNLSLPSTKRHSTYKLHTIRDPSISKNENINSHQTTKFLFNYGDGTCFIVVCVWIVLIQKLTKEERRVLIWIVTIWTWHIIHWSSHRTYTMPILMMCPQAKKKIICVLLNFLASKEIMPYDRAP